LNGKVWQAFYATLLLERSKFGLNELLASTEALRLPPIKKPRQKRGSLFERLISSNPLGSQTPPTPKMQLQTKQHPAEASC